MKEYKLTFELVPEECWQSNLRSALPKEIWDKIRYGAYARAKGKCMICGGYTKRLEAHEQWRYDVKRKLQKLETVVALCKNCHEVKHIGRTCMIGKGDEAMEHFMRVNGCTQSEYHQALGKANEEHKRLNEVEGWTTDISWIKDQGFIN